MSPHGTVSNEGIQEDLKGNVTFGLRPEHDENVTSGQENTFGNECHRSTSEENIE